MVKYNKKDEKRSQRRGQILLFINIFWTGKCGEPEIRILLNTDCYKLPKLNSQIFIPHNILNELIQQTVLQDDLF